jgi:hypothetical protein
MNSNNIRSNEEILDYITSHKDHPTKILQMFNISSVSQKFKTLLDYYKPRGDADLSLLTSKKLAGADMTQSMIKFVDSISDVLVIYFNLRTLTFYLLLTLLNLIQRHINRNLATFKY